MAGLLQQGMGQPQGAPQPSPQAQSGQPQGQSQGGRDPRVDMDPQQGAQQREQLVNAMLESLYGPMLPQVRQILEEGGQQPEQAIGRIVAQLMLGVWQMLTEKGSTVPPGVMVQAAMVVSQAVGEMAVRLRILPEQGNGEAIEAGFMMAMAQFGQATAESMPPAQRQRYGELIRGLREAKGMSQQRGGQGQPQQPPQGAGQPGPQGGM
ncbi:hypothetical protein DFO67_108136 [Modicisalibacter xianhensis]|uniref:Uncharacterized protein n=1 Tax=Modicisalibacter xianhensis TaxID=442341 RepID=A0A4R8FZJ7_9GAMM|nr:hypothetical protein [Halomonas xianhensis]TDX29092.1 hypothetical protein DFO67_108136 [Halomonas xianhensis]